MAASDRSAPDQRFELLQTLVLALAAVLTAWAAFQSTKWGGVQANSYARASAARVESTRADNRAGQNRILDTQMFTSWVAAIAAETRAGLPLEYTADGIYRPEPTRESGFLLSRFRDEFRPVMDAWLATRPLVDPDAPSSPFDMPAYDRLEADKAAELEQVADDFSAEARQANQRGDNYVMTTILFATVLVLASLASKMTTPRARSILLGLAVTALVVTALVVLSYPKEY